MEFFRGRERTDAPGRIDLDALYYDRSSEKFIKALRTFPMLFNLTLRQLEKQVIENLKNGNTTIHKELYKAHSENLSMGVAGVMNSDNYSDKYFDLQQQLQANVSRFAAYKAYQATQQIKCQLADEDGVERSDADYRKYAKAVFDTYHRYQIAEYNTTVARARTAKQWTDFNSDELSNEMYPNLKWLPSSSATPREEHRVFWGLVLPKDHPFWQTNQPGNIWNCKCDWEETDEPAAEAYPKTKIAATGLEGNPAETGEVFTDNATYFSNLSKKQQKEVAREYRALETENLSTKYKGSGNIVNYTNIQSGKILESNNAYKRMLEHCYGEDQFAAARAIPYEYQNFENPRPEDIGTRKKSDKKSQKNIQKKIKRGVVEYVWYDWKFNNMDYVVAMEKHTKGFEQVYGIYKKK